MPSSQEAGPLVSGRLTHHTAFQLQGIILLTFMAAASVPTPLYSVYREQWGFSAITLTVIFGVYALSLLMALLTMGALSDYVGRRPVITAALLVQVAAILFFAFAYSVSALLIARLLQGFATGMAASALGAGLLDLDRMRGALINGLAPALGLALGALCSSVLVQFAPFPLRLVYVALLILALIQAALAMRLPETVTAKPGALASLRPNIRASAMARKALLLSAPINIAVWSMNGFYLSLGPTLARSVIGSDQPLVGGLLVFVLTISGAVAVLMQRIWPPSCTILTGARTLIVGLGVTLAGVHLPNAWIFFAGTAIAGFGFGSGLVGALRIVVPAAEPNERSAVLAAFYVIGYLALSLPAIAAGMLTQIFGLIRATNMFCGTLIVLAAIAAIVTHRARGQHG